MNGAIEYHREKEAVNGNLFHENQGTLVKFNLETELSHRRGSIPEDQNIVRVVKINHRIHVIYVTQPFNETRVLW